MEIIINQSIHMLILLTYVYSHDCVSLYSDFHTVN